MGYGHFWWRAEYLMKRIYFVTEGKTDQIVIEGLITQWLGDEDFIPNHIQPPSSAYAEGLDSNLSEGWKGVLAWWCQGERRIGPASRDEAFRQADCLIIHLDADVAADPHFKSPAFEGPSTPARHACDWIRDHLAEILGGSLPPKAVLCVPAQDLEAWIVCALHPAVADEHAPIESHPEPCGLLAAQKPPRLVRSKDGRLRKDTAQYRASLDKIAKGWPNCLLRCPEALRFEQDTKQVLGV
jgi:hypothetical protein